MARRRLENDVTSRPPAATRAALRAALAHKNFVMRSKISGVAALRHRSLDDSRDASKKLGDQFYPPRSGCAAPPSFSRLAGKIAFLLLRMRSQEQTAFRARLSRHNERAD